MKLSTTIRISIYLLYEDTSLGTCTAAYIHTSVMETAMIIVTVVVKAMWLNNMEIINRLKDSEDNMVTKIEKNYIKTGKKVEQILTVFQRWFIVQLIVFTIVTAGYLVLIIKNRYQGAEFKYGMYILIHLLSDFVAFLIFYSCGLTINFFHEKYYKSLINMRQDILSQSDHEQIRLMKYAGTIPANSNTEEPRTLNCFANITVCIHCQISRNG